MNINKGDFIYRQQEKGKGFYYLDKGLISNSIISPEGIEHTINYITEGMLFGEPGIYNQPYLASAITLKPSTVYYFSNTKFDELCRKFPSAKLIFTHSLIFKLRTMAEIIAFMGCTAEQKIAHFTIKLDREVGRLIPFNQTKFAKYLGISRKSVNKILNNWKKEGIISIINNELIIEDAERLRELGETNTELNVNIDYLLSVQDITNSS